MSRLRATATPRVGPVPRVSINTQPEAARVNHAPQASTNTQPEAARVDRAPRASTNNQPEAARVDRAQPDRRHHLTRPRATRVLTRTVRVLPPSRTGGRRRGTGLRAARRGSCF